MDTVKLDTMGERVRFARQLNKLTLQALADKIGMTKQSVHNFEIGKTRQTGKMIELADALKVNLDWLARGRGQIWMGHEQCFIPNDARGHPEQCGKDNMQDVLSSLIHRVTVLESRLAHV